MSDVVLTARMLLRDQIRSYLALRRDITQKVHDDFAKGKLPSKSWPKGLRKWRDSKQRELLAFAKTLKLCRANLKQDIIDFKQSPP